MKGIGTFQIVREGTLMTLPAPQLRPEKNSFSYLNLVVLLLAEASYLNIQNVGGKKGWGWGWGVRGRQDLIPF